MTQLAKKPWAIATVLAAAALFAIACSDAVYEITSPSFLSWHVALRKFYSIVAFTLVGYLFRRALAEAGAHRFVLPAIVGVALYSAGIEVGQFFVGSKEGLGWNTFDTVCGAAGGALATADLWLRPARIKR